MTGGLLYVPVLAGVGALWNLAVDGKLQFSFTEIRSRAGWDGEDLALVIVFTIAAVIVAPLFTLQTGSGLSWRTSADEKRWTLKRNKVPYLCAQLVRCCAQVRPSSTRRRKVLLKRIDQSADDLIRELMRLPRDRGLYPRRSPRRQAVHRHVALVAAALRKKTLELDTEPERAFYELSQMSLKICTAYVGRRWGRLLEDSELSGLEPFRRRESLRITSALVITVAAAYGASAAGLPSAVLPLVIGAVGVLAFTLIVGRTPQALALLDSMRGIQRP
ncbi:hypothetical protein ACFVEN_44440 [Streptomyces sp. NPDC057681]|uniref:hypothetical protein n=1 Tax=Streptomyces sp. NPDC057681 TaxID=3346209 RepID=UPI003688CC4A